MEELLSLKWNNHRSTFLHILAVLRDKQLYTDATLACDGKLYSVHKLVLSTCSDYFSSMLDRTSCKSPVIVLKDIKSEDLEALLDYMYLGEVNVRQSDLATLIKAAECLRVKGLAVADDEPPPRKVRGSDTQGRRGDTSGSPPAKRKRRDIDDGRDDVRPSKHETRHSSPVHSTSNRPKSPLSNNHTSTTNRNSSSNNSISNNSNQDSTNTSRQELNNKNSGNADFDECTPCVKVELEDNQDGVEDTEGDRNIGDTGGDSNTGDLGDSYNLTNEDFKEENDTEGGGDLANDLPEFLQQATSGYSHSSFAGPSFQPELSWQGSSNDGGGLAGSFAAAAASLSFGGSGSGASQDGAGHSNAAGMLHRARSSHATSLQHPPHHHHHRYQHLKHTLIPASLQGSGERNISGGAPPSTSSSAAFGRNSALSSEATATERFLLLHSLHGLQRSLDVAESSAETTFHMRSDSTVSCDQCGKVFHGEYCKYNLKKHLTIHAGIKPYACSFCSRSFNQKSSMRRHMSVVHGVNPDAAAPALPGPAGYAGHRAVVPGEEEEEEEEEQSVGGHVPHDAAPLDLKSLEHLS